MKTTKIKRDDKNIGCIEQSVKWFKKNKPDVNLKAVLELAQRGYDSDGDAYGSTYMIIKTSSKIDLKSVKMWAYDNLETRCYCEFDCCGHWFSNVNNVKRLKNRKYAITINSARNY